MQFLLKHKRGLFLCFFTMLVLVLGFTLLNAGLEDAGALYLLVAVGALPYVVLSPFYIRKKTASFKRVFYKNERYGLLIFFSMLCFVGLVASFPKKIVTTIIFAELLLFSWFAIYILFRLNQENTSFKQQFKRNWLYWSFLVSGIGFFLLIITAALYEYQPLLDIIDPFFMLFLTAFVLIMVIRHIASVISLKKEKTTTELMHLKSQVNPHFFFNMLNNLYGLVDKDTDKAKALILKLSDMMRYSIYDGQKDLVLLDEEIDYLKHYMELHQMRYHKDITMDFHTSVQNGKLKVVPLLFIILLENAFKHGVENLRNDAFVNVAMLAHGKEITFTVENNFDATQLSDTPGIGLQNLKRRLELTYPKRHLLKHSINNNVYKAQLTLQL